MLRCEHRRADLLLEGNNIVVADSLRGRRLRDRKKKNQDVATFFLFFFEDSFHDGWVCFELGAGLEKAG
jgi:hypothetical protein